MKRIIPLLFVFFIPKIFLGQEYLSLKNAIDSALLYNYEIIVCRNNAAIAEINNNLGVIGALPTISMSASDYETFYNINQKLSSGSEVELKNVSANSLNAGANFSLTLFNGMKIHYTKTKYNLLQEQAELLLNYQVQNTIALVMVKYFDVIRQQNYLRIFQSLFDISKKKLEIVNQRKSLGLANDADWLQSKIDLNEAEQKINQQQVAIKQAKDDLLQIIGIKSQNIINIRDTIIVDNSVSYDSLANYLNRNFSYQNAEYLIKINELSIKEISSQNYPSLKAIAAYNLSLSQSEYGQYLYNQSLGPLFGASLQVPLYNGNIMRNQKKIAQLNLNSSLQYKNNVENLYYNSISKFYTAYSNSLQQIESQKNNCELAEALVDLILKKFQYNQATIIELKNAQLSYENAYYNLINHQYAAKVSEIELKRLIFKIE